MQLVTGRQGLFLIVVIVGSIQAAAGARSQSLQHRWLIHNPDHGGSTMNLLQRVSATAALTAIFTSTPALAQKVETDYDHSVNFTRYHTYC